MSFKITVSQEAFTVCAGLERNETVVIRQESDWLPAVLSRSRLDGQRMIIRPITQRGTPRRFKSLNSCADWLESLEIRDFAIMPKAPED